MRVIFAIDVDMLSTACHGANKGTLSRRGSIDFNALKSKHDLEKPPLAHGEHKQNGRFSREHRQKIVPLVQPWRIVNFWEFSGFGWAIQDCTSDSQRLRVAVQDRNSKIVLGKEGKISSDKHLNLDKSLSRKGQFTMTSKMDKRMMYALVGTAAIGAGAGLAYYFYKTRCETVSDMVDLEVTLEQAHVTWLDGIATKYTGGDKVKALYLLVEHCKTASSDDAVAEAIFKKVRCKACGKKEKVAFTASMSRDHVSFINSALEKYEISGGQDKTLRVMFEYVINETQESAVFGG